MADVADDLASIIERSKAKLPLVRGSVLPPMTRAQTDAAASAPPPAELRASSPPVSDKLGYLLADTLEGWGVNPQTAMSVGRGAANLASYLPFTGEGIAAGDVTRSLAQGDYPGAAISAASLVVPGAAKAVRGAAKAAGRTAGDVAAEASKLFDTSRLSEVPNVKQFDLPRYQPARGVPARTQELIENPDVRAKMIEVIQRGREMGGGKWYNAEPLREAFNAELGKGGDAAFRQYMDMVAATSPRSDVGTNVRNASYYYTLARQGQPMPAIGTPNPQPYGHMAQRLHQQNAGNVVGAGWNPLQNPKPASFVENLAGNQAPVTVDTHAFRLPAMLAEDPRFLETRYITGKGSTPRNIQAELKSGQTSLADALQTPAFWQSQPKENEYAALEQYYKSLGADLGLTPAQTQAAAWVGGGPITGLASDSSKAFVDFVEDRAVKTAQARGITPAEALSQMISGKAPLLSLGGAAAAAPYLLTSQDDQGGT
ncbi:hypothetical protein QIH85_24015 [Bradyrhizobium japonicum]|uniref:DUF7178 family protein n=1 Tax=Bradyrhizobium japonicum TaxID=375 RepID=UPI00271483A8|nr:hypothetical protein [Bradyrhizobium japonicum]WLB24950.1 hypothetical protein QIH85_24015 [Bradyrhizobium japonicum]